MRPSKLPAFNDKFGRNGTWFAGVRQTRLGFKTYIPAGKHVIKTVFDFDMFGVGVDAGQTTMRLRHAWGEYGKIGAGQTESTFMDLDVFPNVLDYWGPDGMVFFRNVQLRWTPWSEGDSNAMISLERPGASADGGVYEDRIELQNVRARFRWPDVAGHVRYGGKRGHIQVSGIVRDMKWDDLLPSDPINLDGGAVGWGVNVSANINIRKDVLHLSVVYGKGVENYMNDAPIDVGIVNNFSNRVTPILGTALPVLGTVSFLDHVWSEKFTSSIGYSMVDISNSDGEAPIAFRRGQYGIANLLYYPVKPVLMGAEFQWGRRSDFSNGYKFNDYKIQVSFKYSFSFTLERR
jgi:DcaP outer membrane protein